MHTEFYGLQQHPFQMTPDARLFFPSTVHRRAHAHLTYGLAQREGFIVVTGEVGAGKTTLIERLCDELDPQGFVIARITTTLVSGDDVLRMVADAFGANPEGNKAAVLRGIAAALRASRRRHLLIVDEAQGLLPPALEELRMLSNLTHPGQPPLQTILMGQPQLRRLLASPDLSQLRQRVLASYHLGGLTREETHGYVMHRLRAVGWTGRPSWDEAALDLVHHHTDGIPRRINRLCARVLLSGALEELDHFTAELVSMTALELEEDLGGVHACARAAQASRAVAPAVPAPTPPTASPLAPAAPETVAEAAPRRAEATPRRMEAPLPGASMAARMAPAPRVPPSRMAVPRTAPPRPPTNEGKPASHPRPAQQPPSPTTPGQGRAEAPAQASVESAAPAATSQAPLSASTLPEPVPPASAQPCPAPRRSLFSEIIPPDTARLVSDPPVDGHSADAVPVEGAQLSGAAADTKAGPPMVEQGDAPAACAVHESSATEPGEAANAEAPLVPRPNAELIGSRDAPMASATPLPEPAASPAQAPPAEPVARQDEDDHPPASEPHAPPPADGEETPLPGSRRHAPAVPRMLHTQALPHLDAELYDTLTRPPPPPPMVPVRRRDEEPERLFAWVFKLLPNNRSRR